MGDTIAQFEFPDFSSKIDVLQKAVLQWSYFVHFRSNTLQSTWQGVHFQQFFKLQVWKFCKTFIFSINALLKQVAQGTNEIRQLNVIKVVV